jgi:hypothetical protein
MTALGFRCEWASKPAGEALAWITRGWEQVCITKARIPHQGAREVVILRRMLDLTTPLAIALPVPKNDAGPGETPGVKFDTESAVFCWSEVKIAVLRELWGTDMRAADIGRQLGTSKGAVIGKANRLGLPRRDSGAFCGRPRR